MAKHLFFLIDAFADRPLSGNPCAVVLDADDLDDSRMQSIATEMNLSETAFVRRSERCDFPHRRRDAASRAQARLRPIAPRPCAPA